MVRSLQQDCFDVVHLLQYHISSCHHKLTLIHFESLSRHLCMVITGGRGGGGGGGGYGGGHMGGGAGGHGSGGGSYGGNLHFFL